MDNYIYFPGDGSIILLMNALKNRRNLIIAAIAVGIVALLSYRFLPALVQTRGDSVRAVTDADIAITREISSVATYEVPGGTDKVRFTIGLDTGGRVVSVKSTDALKGDTVSENLAKFSQGLLLVIGGKKLNELTAVDRIGKSSLTTTAFNSVLSDLKVQI